MHACFKDSKDLSKSEVDNFRGQSHLHVAKINGYNAVKDILNIATENDMTQELLCIQTTGIKFKNKNF